MKILVTGSTLINQSHSIVKSFQQLGHEVAFVKMIEFYKQCNYIERKFYKLGVTSLETNYIKKWNENFINICTNFQPDIVFIINGFVIEHITLQLLNKRGIKTILWLVDSVKHVKGSDRKLNYYDKIYCFEEDDIPYLQNKYGLNSYYCPVGFDEEYYYPSEIITRDIDICFVGHTSDIRLEIMKHVAYYVHKKSLTMRIYGTWWDKKYFWKKTKIAKKHAPLDQYIFNYPIDASQVGDIYRRSKICLNIHNRGHNGINPRTFEILGTRSFELMDERKKTDGIIRPGIDLVMYADIGDLINKIEYYLANEKARGLIANNGYEWVKARYTMKHMVKNIIDEYSL